MKKKLTLLTLLIMLLFGMNNLMGQDKDWTLLLYVVGTDIVEDAITDIGEMKAAGNTDNINIVGLLGGAQIEGWETPSASAFVNGEEVSVDFMPKDTFMVSADNLKDFINWGTSNYPAEKYMLLFYNHGMAIRGWGWENVTDDQFNIDDIKFSIEESDFFKNGNKFEVLGFDACLMGCIEAQSALRNVANYYMGSEETEPWHAWNWTPIITAMNTMDNLNGGDLGRLIVDTYLDHHVANNTHHVTLSCIDLNNIEPLEKSIENLVLSLNDDIYLENFLRARGNSEEYSKSISNPETSEDMVDIGDLVTQLKDLEPSLEALIDTVLARLDDAVVYERSDDTRPKASGISMYVPMNTFIDTDALYDVIDTRYSQITFSDTIRNFILNDYLPYALADNEPLSGSIDNSLGVKGENDTQRGSNTRFSAIKLNDDHADDLHHLQVILIEEVVDVPDEYIVLGSTHADTVVHNEDGSSIYGYEWDEEWLSLNGIPAYVADIQDFEVNDSMGNVIHEFTRLHIPAILNPATENEKYIMFSYVVDEGFNYKLEGILRESYTSGASLVTSKERILLQPGDQVQLIYEVFDTKTNEAFFTANPNAVITVENGNEDIILGHARLETGKYHIGFVLMDHSHNDTIIYDPLVREVMTSSVEVIPAELAGVTIYPNPTTDLVNIEFGDLVEARISVFNSTGKEFYREYINSVDRSTLNLGRLPAGIYFININLENKILQKEIIKY